ncbi:MAG: hypothetical protein AB7V42_11265 [Thermoleophilia bacterium]
MKLGAYRRTLKVEPITDPVRRRTPRAGRPLGGEIRPAVRSAVSGSSANRCATTPRI